MTEAQSSRPISTSPPPGSRLTCLYLRVSTLDPVGGLENQECVLREYCDTNKIINYRIFSDDGTSVDKSNRPAFEQMMELVRAGQAERVIVHSYSRVARSVTHLLSTLEELREANTSFVSCQDAVDTNTPMGRDFLAFVIAGVSRLERELLQERVKTGLRKAKAAGVRIGRKKTRPSELIRALYKKGLPIRSIASLCGTSHGSVGFELRLIREEEAEAKLRARIRTAEDR